MTRKRLFCLSCRGRHQSDRCPNYGIEPVKQFGTIGANRCYIPPKGVKVRILHLPNTVHGQDLARIFEEPGE